MDWADRRKRPLNPQQAGQPAHPTSQDDQPIDQVGQDDLPVPEPLQPVTQEMTVISQPEEMTWCEQPHPSEFDSTSGDDIGTEQQHRRKRVAVPGPSTIDHVVGFDIHHKRTLSIAPTRSQAPPRSVTDISSVHAMLHTDVMHNPASPDPELVNVIGFSAEPTSCTAVTVASNYQTDSSTTVRMAISSITDSIEDMDMDSVSDAGDSGAPGHKMPTSYAHISESHERAVQSPQHRQTDYRTQSDNPHRSVDPTELLERLIRELDDVSTGDMNSDHDDQAYEGTFWDPGSSTADQEHCVGDTDPETSSPTSVVSVSSYGSELSTGDCPPAPRGSPVIFEERIHVHGGDGVEAGGASFTDNLASALGKLSSRMSVSSNDPNDDEDNEENDEEDEEDIAE